VNRHGSGQKPRAYILEGGKDSFQKPIDLVRTSRTLSHAGQRKAKILRPNRLPEISRCTRWQKRRRTQARCSRTGFSFGGYFVCPASGPRCRVGSKVEPIRTSLCRCGAFLMVVISSVYRNPSETPRSAERWGLVESPGFPSRGEMRAPAWCRPDAGSVTAASN
jgi:hypothetical protein